MTNFQLSLPPGATKYENQVAKPEFYNFEIALNLLETMPEVVSRRELLISWFKSQKGAFCVIRYWTALLQEKNFGPNVIYCVGTDYKW